MTTPPTNPTPAGDLRRIGYHAALASAIIAGVFSLVVCAGLAVTHVRTRTLELQKSEELAGLREAILKASDAEAVRLKEMIRTRDLELRDQFFRRQSFATTGGYLLVGGIVVFVIAAARVAAYRKRLPMPRYDPDAPRRATVTARLARGSVIALGIAIGAAGLALGIFFGGPPAEPGQEEGAGQGAPVDENWPTPEEITKQWPRFRGPGGLGISAYANIPTAWSAKTGEGIAWKTRIPLPGHNSPVIWGDRLFLTGADDKKREVYCFDTASGKILWQKSVETPQDIGAEPPEPLEDTGFAASTAATDGRRVAAVFGNGDIACFDCSGKQLWAKNIGPFKNSYGYSSSLNMYRNTVLVLVDQGVPGKTNSSLLALDAATGKTAWETKRPVPSSWATPIIVDTGKGQEVVTCAKPWVIAYDPAKGAELWRAKVLDGDVAPSPSIGAGLVFTANTGAKLSAIRPDGRGDVTATHVAWSAEDGLPDIVSPLANGTYVWLVTTDGTLTCYNVKDGKKVYEKEIDAIFKSSPGLVGDRLYLTDDKGVTRIISAGPEYKEITTCDAGEPVSASLCFLDGRIYIRGKDTLFAIGKR